MEATAKSIKSPGKLVALGRFLVLGVVWIALQVAVHTLPSDLVSKWNVIIAAVVAPVACFVFLRGIVSSRKIAVASAASCAVVVAFALLCPHRILSNDSLVILAGLGALAGLQLVLLVAALPSNHTTIHHIWLLLACIIWWGSWGSAVAVSPPSLHVETREFQCASNLKQVGVALLKYEEQEHKPALSVTELVKAEIISKDTVRCPNRGEYKIIPLKDRTRNRIVAVCSNHRGQRITLRQDTRVAIEKSDD